MRRLDACSSRSRWPASPRAALARVRRPSQLRAPARSARLARSPALPTGVSPGPRPQTNGSPPRPVGRSARGRNKRGAPSFEPWRLGVEDYTDEVEALFTQAHRRGLRRGRGHTWNFTASGVERLEAPARATTDSAKPHASRAARPEAGLLAQTAPLTSRDQHAGADTRQTGVRRFSRCDTPRHATRLIVRSRYLSRRI
jgi:hypothetical protein